MKDYHQSEDKIISNDNSNYQRTNTINKTGDTIPRMIDNTKSSTNNEMLNINKNEIKNEIPIISNTMYSFGDNNNTISNNNNNKDLNLNNNYENRYQNMSNLPYKTRSDLTDINQNNLINSNINVNEGRSNDNLMFITPSNYANRKYKTEKRMNREKDEYYKNMQKN